MSSIFIVLPGLEEISRSVLLTSEPGHAWVGRSNLVVLPNGVWVHTYRAATSHFSTGVGEVHIRFSANQGATWTAADTTLAGVAVTNFPVSGHGGMDAAEGYLLVALNGALLMLVREEGTSSSGGTYVWRSTDNGATWTDEGQINSDDTLLMGGQAIIIGSDIYATFWIDAGPDQTPPFYSTLYKSSDDGSTWTHISDISSLSDATAEEGLIQLADGTLLCVLRANNNLATYMRRSSDLGATWGDLEDVKDRFSILHRPKFRCVGGRIYLHGRNYIASGTGGYYVVYFSDDEAVTWRGPYYLQLSIADDDGYGDLLPRGDGSLYSVHYEGSTSDTNIYQTVTAVDA